MPPAGRGPVPGADAGLASHGHGASGPRAGQQLTHPQRHDRQLGLGGLGGLEAWRKRRPGRDRRAGDRRNQCLSQAGPGGPAAQTPGRTATQLEGLRNLSNLKDIDSEGTAELPLHEYAVLGASLTELENLERSVEAFSPFKKSYSSSHCDSP